MAIHAFVLGCYVRHVTPRRRRRKSAAGKHGVNQDQRRNRIPLRVVFRAVAEG